MRLLKFSERFNLEMDSQEARRRFMLRMNVSFFQSDFYKKELRTHHDVLAQKSAAALLEQYRFYTTPLSYVGDDFYRCLQVIEVMYQHFQEVNDRERMAKIETLVKDVLSHDAIRLALDWKDGRFFPTGPDLLDRSLIEETVTWLAVLDSKPLIDAYAHVIQLFIKPEQRSDATAEWLNALHISVTLFLKELSGESTSDVFVALSHWSARFKTGEFGQKLATELVDFLKIAGAAPKLSRADRESLLFAVASFFRWNIETVYRRSES